ncbi:bifunctional alpha,alpha-trehalose-phosphate synthase (UDP-forming)/trehalose-phosphatase [Fulvivirga sp. M361]|uniref:bifunctional alpha,alpha-trehalose-phosphate synthase (UDP-forming)/trehalose-phosphatase n=1 Tax=Fulvivirga sp. M361 TaxID=2594266 RepID=UPI00117A6C03|nr:bifunctional alpha,alpha-trehalose-phosphate synthase (UDP-forming)/trehalose-phosphatase [Fulvivirga sp. M361]TRX48805.1 bifunctional alpha,alpha-trehalose-phosphate synthase (UDP-forming)/trehalose-phosphatase [Fulvivirga sp. M361]
MGRTIIVSNRLPVKVAKDENGKLRYKSSEGGLATGLGSVYKDGDNIWVGWPGFHFDNEEEEKEAAAKLKLENMKPVALTEEEIELYYEGFSNETLWPTFHYFNQNALYKKSYWQAYEEVNHKFCKEVVEVANPDDTIWVHDYQLLLLPGLIREKLPSVSIGFFLHIPFPSFEVFRLLPWRRQLLDGVLGSDLIGFHTYDDMRHFLSAVSRICFISNQHGQLNKDGRTVEVDSFPMGIDYEKYANSSASPQTLSREVKFRTSLGAQKLMLSIDRLDYSKGIPARLEIFDLFFQKYPEYLGKVSLMMVVVPSRDNVEQYRGLKEEIDLLVGRINGKYGAVNWTPIHYFYRSFPLSDLSAYYRMADVALVTPMRDGMNLVCKEYVASRLDKQGVLILSEMAGASKELSEAIIVNPNDKHQVRDAIKRALEMTEEEQIRHMEIMQASLKKYNIHHWVKLFMDRLHDVFVKQKEMTTKLLDSTAEKTLIESFRKSDKKLLFLDYDGTLAPFNTDPTQAGPDEELHEIIKGLTKNKKNNVVVISGRDRNTLENWLGQHDIEFVAEHGVWIKHKGKAWETSDKLDNSWKDDIRPIMEIYVNKTPGSFIEEKDYSLVWHFRKVETGLGELRSREIISHLKYLAVNMNLQVLEGSMVVEIKNLEVNKGKAAMKWVQEKANDFILAIGDDATDEDTFKALPDQAFTIKVGDIHSAARFSLMEPKQVRNLLKQLI